MTGSRPQGVSGRPCPLLVTMPDDELPELAVMQRSRLIASHWGQYMAARYNGPVYLVGSILRSASPRDVDLCVVVADAEFVGRYGMERYTDFPNQAWIDDLAKRNGELARDFKPFNPDFKVYPASYCINKATGPRSLVAAPSDLSHIVASVAWWYNPPPVGEPDTTPEPSPTPPAENQPE